MSETPSNDASLDRAGTAVRGDRFSGGPAREFLSSLAADERIFEADIAVDRAHVVMLAEQGIIERSEASEILTALEAIALDGHNSLPDGEDVHEAIESAVIEQVGPVGGKMHTARSRNDEVATCLRYRLREDLLDSVSATLALRSALENVAREHGDTVMPGFTHLQPAQPTTVAHWALSYERAIARDTERLLAAYDRTNRSPLGGAAFAGTPFPIDRERTAELLGFAGIVENSMDAASARDFLLDSTAALAGLATHLSGLAEDLIVFANKGYVDLSNEYASTSSIMPQKKNPDTLELVRATAGTASAGLDGLLTTLKGLPRAYNIDLQRASGHAWSTVDAVTEATDVAAGAVASTAWNDSLLADAAGEGFTTATAVADRLAMCGLPFRTAHAILAEAAQHGGSVDAIEAAAADVLDEPLETYLTREELRALLDPVHSVENRDSRGGPAPSAVAAQLDITADALDVDRETLDHQCSVLEQAHETLTEVVHSHV
ncbi:argininosuccinate lyase [Halocatena pleomorpha]|uniref:Argininosuccinate lyase n=1 Tax=Halocatena pleomorpha TaxID=1785090 RepID=A0A3P3RFR1_9EURY|nr:argininosuccinate lyase [Halocatena pleomorpha]RRJ32357.1 argininosuccinate lyase [Halocatena pleomorpha]